MRNPAPSILRQPLSRAELGNVIVEHPAWWPTENGHKRVFELPGAGRALVTVTPDTVTQHPLDMGLTQHNGATAEPRHDTFRLGTGELGPVPQLRAALTELGTITRYRTSTLWEAFAWAILRLRSEDAPELTYRSFCAYGEHVHLPDGSVYRLFPAPRQVLALETDHFHTAGLDKTSRRTLVAAAEAYEQHGADWSRQPRGILYHSLQIVPRVGIATARSAVADLTNDWSLYPYADPELRGYAAQAAPSFDWPDDQGFGPLWQELADGNLSSVTLLTLVWGQQHAAR